MRNPYFPYVDSSSYSTAYIIVPKVYTSLPVLRQKAFKEDLFISPRAYIAVFALYKEPRHVTFTDGHL